MPSPSPNKRPQTLPRPRASPRMEPASAPAERKKRKRRKKRPPPPWIDALIRATFFEACSAHAEWYGKGANRSGGCNLLCLDCRAPVCPRCVQEDARHRGHRAIQVRVSSCQMAVRVADIRPFLDVADVQAFVCNGDRVVCINRRPETTMRWFDGACKVCSRLLRGDCAFCSIECKVAALQAQQPAAEPATVSIGSARERPTTSSTSSSARKRARKATPQRAHLGCTL